MNKDRTIEIQYYDWRLVAWLTSETRDRLNAAGRGIYRELLDQCYAQGSFPDDPDWICRKCACTPEELTIVWPVIERHFPHFPKKKTHRHHWVSDIFRKKVISMLKTAKTSGKKGGQKSQEIKKLARVPLSVPQGSTELTNRTNERNEENERKEHTQSACVRDALPALRKPNADDLNGQTSQNFEQWFSIWAAVRGNAYRSHACQAFTSMVLLKFEPAALACAESYIAGPGADPSHGYRPDNFIFEMARDGFTTRWPATQPRGPERRETAMERALAKAKEAKNGTR